jgi:glycosyltransferase involved in cell wall biosynthesis
MLVSVFTPSHNTRYLDACYAALLAQTYDNWQWVVMLNGDAADWKPSRQDDRVKVVRGRFLPKVGTAKHAACELCEGEILVELDHDDLLAPACLARVHEAFEQHPDVVFVYSDWTQINEDGSRNDHKFNLDMGWEYDEVDIDGRSYLRTRSMEPYPHNVGYIWYAPNHVRAFRKSSYEAIGGYDTQLSVLDDQELMTRMFLEGAFHHIPECLYFQRMHSANTQIEPATNAFIQQQTVRYYQEYIGPLTAAWGRRLGLDVVTVVAPTSPAVADPDPGRILEVDPDAVKLDLPDDSVSLINANELLQRLPDRVSFFNECYRVLVHGGVIITRTPSTDGRGAFQDPSHVAFYNENSFWYLTQNRYRGSVPGLNARLQVGHIRTHFPTPWEEQVNISYVEAMLLAVKNGPRLGGPLHV